MTEEKFIQDCLTLSKFTQCYCDNEHKKEKKHSSIINLTYRLKELDTQISYTLCSECESALKYSYTKLQNCPKEQKPSCRKCLEPCYDKHNWKLLSKIMRYSGMKLGYIKIKKMFKSFRKKV